MLCHGGVNVKHLSAVVVRFGVLGFDVVAEVGAELEAVLLAEIADQHARFKGPVAQPLVGQPVILELARRRVDAAKKINIADNLFGVTRLQRCIGKGLEACAVIGNERVPQDITAPFKKLV